MRPRYSFASPFFVCGTLGVLAAALRASSPSEVRRLASKQPAAADRAPNSSDNFQIHAGWQPLFNGRDLDGWYTFLQQHGRNADPDHIIAIDDGVIHLYRDTANGSRVVLGYIATEKEYGNYHLRLQYRWGEKKFEPRAAHASRRRLVLPHDW